MADENKQNDIGNKFRGLPMAELISAPLMAACDSQKKMAASAYAFMQEIGFEKEGKARLLNFQLERPVGNEGMTSTINVQAPFLGLVPIPSLLIDSVQVNFQMEVTDTESLKEVKNSSGEMDVDANFKLGIFGHGSVKVHGSVSTSRENTRSTNQTAKYQINVNAKQQPPTEGLSKLMDIMASCVEPLPASEGKK